jgi:hypothetical protein
MYGLPGRRSRWRCAGIGITSRHARWRRTRSARKNTTASCGVRVLFAAEPDTEAQVRQLIELAMSGQLQFPDGFTTPWRLRASRPAEVSAEEIELAERLIRS